MAFLEQFSDEDKKLIIGFPYRVGLWISTQDETGGVQSNFAEKIAIHEIIEKKSGQQTGMFGSAFVHEVMSDLYVRRSEWVDWEIVEETFLADAEKVIALIAKTLSENDAHEYAKSAMRVGRHVALAYREFDHKANMIESIAAKIRISLDKFIGMFTKQQYESDTLLNISVEEDKALTQLSDVLEKSLRSLKAV